MEENFELLYERVIDTLRKSDLLAIKQQLESIKGNTVLVGAGGSGVVATFASKALNIPNVRSSRDLNYMNLDNIDNIIVFSYRGKGYTIENLLNKNKNIYIFTNGENEYDNVVNIKYNNTIKKEDSFISLAATLMPMAILLYVKEIPIRGELEFLIERMFWKVKEEDLNIHHNKVYEILTGYDTMTASHFLESTMTESGIATPVVHDKYDYCHGRTTLSYKSNNGLIIFDSNKELDRLILENAKNYYTEIVKINKYYKGEDGINICNDFYDTICSMYLAKHLAENKNMDLSKVDYSPFVKKLYLYRGEM